MSSSNGSVTCAVAPAYQQNPFARAIESFLLDMRRNEDFNSPFFKEVLGQLSTLALSNGSITQGQKCADDLAAFIEDLEYRKRRDCKTLGITQRLRPVVSALSQYVATIDIVIQAAPTAGVVIYCGARLVLQLAQNFYNCFDKVLEIMAEIGHLLRCYRLFSTAFQASHEMQDILVESYKNIVCFWQKASQILSRKSGCIPFLCDYSRSFCAAYKTLLAGLIKPLDAEWQKCRADLDRDRIRVQSLAQATECDLRQRSELRTAEIRQKEQQKRLVEWISAGEELAKLDVRVDLRTNMELHQPGTCTWIQEDPSFKNWCSTTSNSAIWYHAGPGSGKTVLSSALINHLQERDLNVIYFFFSFNDPIRRKLISAIRSLSLQLLTQSCTIPDQVIKLYETDLLHNVPALHDRYTALLVLQAFLKQSSRVHIILDGLDECHDISEVVGVFVKPISTATHGISKWFFTSRDEQEIRSIARQVDAVEIVPPEAAIMSDIRRFIEDRSKGEEVSRVCVDCWTASSQGNFLWINLMLKTLMGMGLTCDEDIEEELDKFPKGLSGCYIRTLQQLSIRPQKHQELARRVFTTLVIAEQPMHLRELSNALGIRENAEDYSSKRIPKKDLVESLCSQLIIFDRTTKDRENDPLLKFAHKSVKDFLLHDPNELGVDESLRQFFINPEAGNLEIGRACMRYLSYSRYQSPQDHLRFLDHDPDGEHAFLKYAATFWFWHIINASHSRQLFEEVERFIRNPAFWTCIAVQSKIAPHLFAPLMEVNRGHFHLGEGYLGGSQNNKNVKFAFPLPDWLELYTPSGPIIVQEFLNFIKDWHPLLTLFPQALSQCLTQVSKCSTYPCRNPFKCTGIRTIDLLPLEVVSSSSSRFSVMSLQIGTDGLSVLVQEKQETSPNEATIVIHRRVASEEACSKEIARTQVHGLEYKICNSEVCLDANTGNLTIWSLDLNNLTLDQLHDTTKKVFTPKGHIEGIKAASMIASLSSWTVGFKRTTYTSYSNISSYHCIKRLGTVHDENDSGYGASIADSSSDPDSDMENNSEDEHLDKDSPVNYHCLIMACQVGAPIWFSWQVNAGLEMQVVHAYHPTKPVAVWSHKVHELRIADLHTGRIGSGILPEPVDVQVQSAAVVHKEFHFSTDGKTLYYMLCTFVDDRAGSICSTSVSTFELANGLDDILDLRRSQPAQRITYEISKPVRNLCAPYILTHWSSTHLHIALPSLSCNSKIVRFALKQIDSLCTTYGAFQTLSSPVYFPQSTPSRNPKLFVYSTTDVVGNAEPKTSEYLILSLDQHCSLEPKDDNARSVFPPVLVMWSISETNTWRDWQPELDDRSPECLYGDSAYNMLRGTFVNPEQRFSIPIRSGLDWRKKAFVSCA